MSTLGEAIEEMNMYISTKLTQYAAVRMGGWKFWRWQVERWNTIVIHPTHEVVSDNLTKKQALGLVKMLEGIRDEQS